MRRRPSTRVAAVGGLTVVLAAAAVVAAFASSSSADSSHATAATRAGARFPEFRVTMNTGLDFLDPGLGYTVQSAEAMWRVYVPLLTYKEVGGPAGATIVPGLATSLPRISDGGRLYTLTLRRGLRYSNGAPIRASDFAYAIERLFKIDSPGVGFYTSIVGAKQFAKTRSGGIPGIVTNDRTGTIRIRLVAPRGDFENILAEIFATPVPKGTPAKDSSTHPIPSTGPYRIASYQPNRRFTIVRNTFFKPSATVSAGNPDRVVVDIVADDGIALQRVLTGKDDYLFSGHTIPPDRLPEIRSRYASRLRVFTPANTYYFFLNTRVAPFDKRAVRQAVNLAVDRRAIVRLFGGLARPTENVLPPTYAQYRRLDLYPYNLDRAKQLVRSAGASGAAVTVWAPNTGLPKTLADYYASVLDSIGLKATEKIIDGSIYWTTIGNQATRAQTGFADWFQDYPHPLDWFDVLLNGQRITATHNNNYSDANVPAINSLIDRLKAQSRQTAAANSQWAALDRMVMQHALWVPVANRQETDFFSSRVQMGCYLNHVLYQFDWYRACVK